MRIRLVGPVVIAAGLAAGCSLIGLGIGTVLDADKKAVSLPGFMVETVQPGRKVTLALRDGRLLTGKYHGLESVADGDPLLRLAVVVIGKERTRVPVGDVVQVQVHGGHAKVIGFVIGAIVDAIVLVAAFDSPSPPPPCGEGGPCTSCPFVYSFDGERYVLDSEVFGGAIFEAAQRSDRASLDHLAEVDGAYRLRLANELQEVQHVDAVKLVVADHPMGTRVVPSLDGRLHVLANPVAPARATDLRGADVRALLAAEGGGAWTSNPLGDGSGGPDGARDGVVFEFARPPGAPSATLVFRAQSTAWASVRLREMLALHGRDQQAWTDHINADPAARAAFLGALRREGLLTVRVWTGAAWREAGFLANMAEAVAREQAIVVDLAGIPGDVLRVRVDSTAGMWILRGAEADFGRSAPARVTELAAVTARTAHGEDVRDLLAAADGRRYVMNPGVDSADLVFDAPPRAPGQRRSFLIEAAGYYTILVPAEGEPQEALYDQLVREPGAFGRRAAALVRDGARRVVMAGAR